MPDSQKALQVAAAVIKNAEGQVLISLRDKSRHQGGFWEFPGGKIEAGENPLQALTRELEEELGIRITAASPLINIHHQYPDLTVQLHAYEVVDFSGVPLSCEGQPIKWVAVDELDRYPFPAANQPIIRATQLPSYYAILDDSDEAQLMDNLLILLNQGIKLIQARLKQLPAETVKLFLSQAYPLCKHHGALLILNSAVELAENGDVFNDMDFGSSAFHQIEIDGMHLTSQHLMTRNQRPKNCQWLSASCHNLEELKHAEKLGADFVVLAPVLSTLTHPGCKPLGWEQFRHWVSLTNLPVYALGGMTKTDLNEARENGGQGIAAIRAFL